MTPYLTLSSDVEIKVPRSIVVCPCCKTQLTVYPDTWVECKDGSYRCSDFSWQCREEQRYKTVGKKYLEWEKYHDWSQSIWQPIKNKIEVWLYKNYRFKM